MRDAAAAPSPVRSLRFGVAGCDGSAGIRATGSGSPCSPSSSRSRARRWRLRSATTRARAPCTTVVAPPPPRFPTTTAPLPTAPEPTVSKLDHDHEDPLDDHDDRPLHRRTAARRGPRAATAGRSSSSPIRSPAERPPRTRRPPGQPTGACPRWACSTRTSSRASTPATTSSSRGIYSSAGEAETALRTVHATGFASAYTRQITR